MEWIKSILEKHRKEDGTVDLDAANKEIDQEFPKMLFLRINTTIFLTV